MTKPITNIQKVELSNEELLQDTLQELKVSIAQHELQYRTY
jgi:hypothetical protein